MRKACRQKNPTNALEHEKRHRTGQMHFVVVDDTARGQEWQLESIERVSIESTVAFRELYCPVGPPCKMLLVKAPRMKELGHRLTVLQKVSI